MAPTFIAWRARHSEHLYRIYAVLLFAVYVAVLAGAWRRNEFVLTTSGNVLEMALWYGFALYIVLQGFPTPRGFYVSLDRITQVGMVLVFGAADAALINGLCSFTYPVLRMRDTHGTGGALFRSMHNAAMFGLMIYGAGRAYELAGGAFQLGHLDWQVMLAVAVLVVATQSLNSMFLHMRAAVTGVHLGWSIDWYAHAIEVPVALVGLLMALVYARMETSAAMLFFVLLVAIVGIARILNDATVALQERKEQLEQKVRERVADIERQGEQLKEANRELEAAAERQERLVRSLQATSEELERQNREDALTGLFNRRYMDQFLHREHERAQRTGQPMTVAMIDIDHFKAVNDTFSHQTGDMVLKTMASILVSNVRALDLVARYGGEEILLCMPDTGIEEGMLVCERARAAIEAHDWSAIAPGLHLTASFGVAQAQGGTSAADLLRVCDARLYEAKRRGRNQVRA